MNAEPIDIDIVRDRSVTVTFDDGTVSEFPVNALRAACPCATCRGQRERGEVAWPRPGQPDTITIVDAQLSGAWGLSIDWSDGHSTGIYAWNVLRRWWQAGLDQALVIDPVPPNGLGDGPTDGHER
jgi:DUF971 family protein